jgi:hypothetical protein
MSKYCPKETESLYCEVCNVRPKEILCCGGCKLCKGCYDGHKCSAIIEYEANDINAIMEEYRNQNTTADSLFTQAMDYYNKEMKIVDEYNIKRVKQLEHENTELREKLISLEKEYAESINTIKNESNNDVTDRLEEYEKDKILYQEKIKQLQRDILLLQDEFQKKVDLEVKQIVTATEQVQNRTDPIDHKSENITNITVDPEVHQEVHQAINQKIQVKSELHPIVLSPRKSVSQTTSKLTAPNNQRNQTIRVIKQKPKLTKNAKQ